MKSQTQLILEEIQLALQAAQAVPMPAQGEAAVALATILEGIVTKSVAAYEAETGSPFDLSKLTLEDPV